MNQSGILIIGANGQLGRALQALYPQATAVDSSELDITNAEQVGAFDWSNISLILNAAAYTNVDGAETPEGRAAAWKVNAKAVGLLASVATLHDAVLVHVSSDYVFDGTKSPHTEEEDFAPLSVYGASKAAGDVAAATAPRHYVLRTSWVVGDGNNFIKTMHMLAGKGVQPKVVADQIGRLTFTTDLAAAAKHLVDSGAAYGTYNVSNDGTPSSWADIARIVYASAGKSADDVTDTTTAEYFAGKEGIAPRPLQSALDLTKIKAAGFAPRDWKEALADYMQTLQEES
jgi:dTDP-4-dehydrorhamnose reductase